MEQRHDQEEPAVTAAPRSLSRIELTCQRLATPFPDRSLTPQPDLVTRRKLTADAQQHSLAHLYTASLQKKKETLKHLEESVYKDVVYHSPKVDKAELPSIISRLYEESSRELMEKRKKMFDERMAVIERPKRVASKEQVGSLVERLYNVHDKEKEESQKLFEKYNNNLPTLIRTKDELDANNDRFYKGGFGKKN